jgi:cysteine synthase A
MIHDDILETVGRTPVVRINRIAPADVNLFVKVESFNPMGSIKDRLALGVIEHAERTGALKPGQTVIEATSGNTGIGLAMVCARKGYPLVVTMAENFSVERRRLMRFLGAKVVLTPASQKGSGMLAKAVELAETHGWFLTRQFENEANADMHSRTTALEILADFEGKRLDYWVTAFGTGGTLKGVARVLRRERPDARVIVAEPDNAPVLASGIAQMRASDGSPAESHPHFRPHPIQGTSPDFIAKLTEDAVDANLIDEIVPVNGADAMRLARELAQKEGIFAGISAGAAFAAALKIAEKVPAGANILCMLPDTGERYLSTPLFEDIDVEMDEEELAISRSTPTCRFDAPAPAAPGAPAAATQSPTADANAEAFVEAAIVDASQPVLMFALEWCEFCWSVRRMFAALDIRYRAVDLDSAANQEGDWGGRVRRALQARTGCPTIPQIFIGGAFVGGCTELFDAWRAGKAQAMLAEAGAAHRDGAGIDPYGFLPKWLHPRTA